MEKKITKLKEDIFDVIYRTTKIMMLGAIYRSREIKADVVFFFNFDKYCISSYELNKKDYTEGYIIKYIIGLKEAEIDELANQHSVKFEKYIRNIERKEKLNKLNNKNMEKIEIVKELKERIKFVKTLNTNYIKDGFSKNLDLLFFKVNGEFDCDFGIDSHYRLQVKAGRVSNKKELIEYLKDELRKERDMIQVEINDLTFGLTEKFSSLSISEKIDEVSKRLKLIDDCKKYNL